MPSQDVAEFLGALHPTGVYEIRAFDCPERRDGKFKSTAAGWFTAGDAEDAKSAVLRLNNLKPPGIFVTLNPCSGELLGVCRGKTEFKSKQTTNDKDITYRRRIVFDFDPERKAGVPATEGELAQAETLCGLVRESLKAAGWPEPIYGLSGNGYYLIYATEQLPNDDESRVLFQRVLEGVAALHEVEGASVDRTMFNASRIIKILGTWSRKGEHSPEPVDTGDEVLPARPHRQSWHEIPDDFDKAVVGRAQLQAIADLASEPEAKAKASKANNKPASDAKAENAAMGFFDEEQHAAEHGTAFDLQAWLDEHNVPVSEPMPWRDGQKWIFTELSPGCKNSPSGHQDHQAAFITQGGDGAIGAGCLHDRCTWSWQDLRMHYEPDCYSKHDETDDGDDGETQVVDAANADIGKNKKGKQKKAKRVEDYKIHEMLRYGAFKISAIPGDEVGYCFEMPANPEFGAHEIPSGKLEHVRSARDFFYTNFRIQLPMIPLAAWLKIVEKMHSIAKRAESDDERDLVSVAARALTKLITHTSKSLEEYIVNDKREVAEYSGSFLSDGVVFIDFGKALQKIQKDYTKDVERIHLSRVMTFCKAKRKHVMRREANFREFFKQLRESELDNLAILAGYDCGNDIYELADRTLYAQIRAIPGLAATDADKFERPDGGSSGPPVEFTGIDPAEFQSSATTSGDGDDDDDGEDAPF